MNTQQLYVIIPIYNRKSLTRDCLKSLHNQTTHHFQIIVVDDGSTDGSSTMIQQEFPAVTLLHGDGNLWWTGAVNKAVQYVLDHCEPEDRILLLNNDLVVAPTYIATLWELAERYPATLIGSVVSTIHDRNLIYSGGLYIDWFTARWRSLNSGRQLTDFPKGFCTSVSTLTGRGVLIPTQVFRQLGLYAQQYLPQHGDTEFPIRAQRAGFATIVSYDAVIYSYVDAKNDLNAFQSYKLANLKAYLTSKKSHCNIYDRFWFAYLTRLNLIQFTLYFVLDMIRVLGSFVRKIDFFQRPITATAKVQN